MIKKKKEIIGEVVSLKNKKTVGIKIVKIKIHPRYLKPIKKTKKIQAHNENLVLSLKDKVAVINSRPYSATKRFLVMKKINTQQKEDSKNTQ